MIKKEKHTCKMFKYKIRRKGIWREKTFRRKREEGILRRESNFSINQ